MARLLLLLSLAFGVHCTAPKRDIHMVLDGDLYIGVVLPVRGDGCKTIQDYGFQHTEAVRFALEKINKKDLYEFYSLAITIGGIILDDCSSGSRGVSLVDSLLDGSWKIKDNKGAYINPDNIVGFVGASTSGKSMDLSKLLQTYNKVLVSPMATSAALNNITEYPNFARTVPADDKQVVAIAAFLLRIGWPNAHIVYEDRPYASGLKDGLMEALQLYGNDTCIGGTYIIQSGGGNADAILDHILNNSTLRTDIVFVFGSRDAPRSFIMAKKQSSDPRAKRLTIIGGESWGINPAPVQQANSAGKGSLSIAIAMPQPDAFIDHLQKLKFGDAYTNKNPFFDGYYRIVFSCGRGTWACSQVDRRITDQSDFVMSNFILASINAVYTIGQAIERRMRTSCGTRVEAVCQSFYGFDDTALYESFLDSLNTTSFVDATGQRFYTENRQGNSGYTYHYWDAKANQEQIGLNYGPKAYLLPTALTFPREPYYNNDIMPVSTCSPANTLSQHAIIKIAFLIIQIIIYLGLPS